LISSFSTNPVSSPFLVWVKINVAPMDAGSGTWAEIQDLERFRDWLIALAQGEQAPPGQGLAERWQDDLKAPGERLSQLFF
jgi:hypothetical protein